MRAKKLLDTPEGSKLTEELIEASLVLEPSLVRIDGFEDATKVLVRRDYEALKASGKVAVISGGGSGHEPAMAGYVGEGLLTAAVCGDVFASPTTKAVLAAIRTVTGSGGCLVIVMNYTGDRINFGVAVEEAKLMGLKVDMLFVKDDVAIEGAAQPRGICGTVLVHKTAGALAANGESLDKVKAGAETCAATVKSMGAALTSCTLPGQPPSARLGLNEVEIGLGIHGEPGAHKDVMLTSSTIIGKLFARICEAGEITQGNSCVVLVNNLGATTPMEMTIATAAAVRECRQRGIVISGLAAGSLMTSLDMLGVSITLLKVDDSCLALLTQPTTAPSWVPLRKVESRGAQIIPMPPVDKVTRSAAPADLQASAAVIKKCVTAACHAIAEAEPELTAADAKVGDGDCGETLKKGAMRVLQVLGDMPLTAHDTLLGMSEGVENSMGGTSGTLYLLGLKAAASSMPKQGVAGEKEWAAAFVAFVDAIVHYGGAGVGSGTMCDALIPAADVLRSGGTLEKAVSEAKAGALTTATLKATHGRAAAVPGENQEGVEDPGATAVAIWMAAAFKAAS